MAKRQHSKLEKTVEQSNGPFTTQYFRLVPSEGSAKRAVKWPTSTNWIQNYEQLALHILKVFRNSAEGRRYVFKGWFNAPRFRAGSGNPKGTVVPAEQLPQEVTWARDLLFHVHGLRHAVKQNNAVQAADEAHMVTECGNRIFFSGFASNISLGKERRLRNREFSERRNGTPANIHRRRAEYYHRFQQRRSEYPDMKIGSIESMVAEEFKVKAKSIYRARKFFSKSQ